MGIFDFVRKKESAAAESVNSDKEMLDRLCSHAGNIIDMLKSALAGEKGTDLFVVTLFAAGLAGIACHEAVKALGEPMVEVSCADGKKFFMGDAVNKYLHENKYSVTGFACAISGAPEEALMGIIQRQAGTLGTENFVVAGGINPSDLYKNVKSCWDGIKNNMTLQYCNGPEEWPVLYGIVLQNIMREAMSVAPKEEIFNTAVDVACALSKMDQESL